MDRLEKAFYELRPYIYLSVALGAVARAGDSKLMQISGILLLAMALVVIHARLKHRGMIRI